MEGVKRTAIGAIVVLGVAFAPAASARATGPSAGTVATQAPATPTMAQALAHWTAYPAATVEWRTTREKQLTDSATNWPDRTGKTHSAPPATRNTPILKQWDNKNAGAWFTVNEMDVQDNDLSIMDANTRNWRDKPGTAGRIPLHASRATYDGVLRNPTNSSCGLADSKYPLAARCMQKFVTDMRNQCDHNTASGSPWKHARCGDSTSDRLGRGDTNNVRIRYYNWKGDVLGEVHTRACRGCHLSRTNEYAAPTPVAPFSAACTSAEALDYYYDPVGNLVADYVVNDNYCFDTTTLVVSGVPATPQILGYCGIECASYDAEANNPYTTYFTALNYVVDSGALASSQGSFCFIPTPFGCMKSWDPVVALYMYGDGSFYGTPY